MKIFHKAMIILLLSAFPAFGQRSHLRGLGASAESEITSEVSDGVQNIISVENALRVQETQPLYKKCLPAANFGIFTLILGIITWGNWPGAEERRGGPWGPRGILTKGTAILGFFSAQQMLDNLSTCITEATYSPNANSPSYSS